MISVSEAKELIIKHTKLLKPVEISLWEARGLVLAQNVKSDMNIPPLTNSAMDGYAVRAEDQHNASRQTPAVLKLIGEVKAGEVFRGTVNKGQAVRIMTGATLPKGTDSVVRQEDTQESRGVVSIYVPVKKGDNVRYAGEDIRKGEIVAHKGELLTPALLGVVASAGPAKVKVYPRPVVATLATGDEVVDAGVKPAPGQIRSSNSYTMYHQMAQFGAIPLSLGIAKDTLHAVEAKIKQALKKAHIFVTSGGISVGKYDFVGSALAKLGFKTIFYRVKQRPGQPMAFGKIGDMLVFALPGNPVSSMVCAIQYVRPAIRKMMGFPDLALPEVDAEIEEDIRLKENRTYFLRGILRKENDKLYVRTTGPQGSGILKSMARGNCLIVLPPTRTKVGKGEIVRVQIYEETPWTAII